MEYFLGGLYINTVPCLISFLLVNISNNINSINIVNYKYKIKIKFINLLLNSTLNILMFSSIYYNNELFFYEKLDYVSFFQSKYSIIFLIFSLFIFTVIHTNLISNKSEIGRLKNNFYYLIFSNTFSYLIAIFISIPYISSFFKLHISRSDHYYYFIIKSLFFLIGFNFPRFFLEFILKIKSKSKSFIKILSILLTLIFTVNLIWLIYLLSIKISILTFYVFISVILISSLLIRFVRNKLIKYNLVSIMIFTTIFMVNLDDFTKHKVLNKNNRWVNFSNIKLDENISKGNTVFVNFKSSWCLTCFFNELMILNSDEFINFVNKNDIVLMECDITDKNNDYNELIRSINNYDIPLFLIYSQINQFGTVINGILNLSNIKNEYKNHTKIYY